MISIVSVIAASEVSNVYTTSFVQMMKKSNRATVNPVQSRAFGAFKFNKAATFEKFQNDVEEALSDEEFKESLKPAYVEAPIDLVDQISNLEKGNLLDQIDNLDREEEARKIDNNPLLKHMRRGGQPVDQKKDPKVLFLQLSMNDKIASIVQQPNWQIRIATMQVKRLVDSNVNMIVADTETPNWEHSLLSKFTLTQLRTIEDILKKNKDKFMNTFDHKEVAGKIF